MAITREELKKLGLEDEAVSKVLDMHHEELKEYKDRVSKLEDVEKRAIELKKDFDEQSKRLKELEAGDNNPEKLKEEIAKLTRANEEKDKAHKKAIEDMEIRLDNNSFDTMLNSALSKAGAKRNKAVIAELDIESLKASKNREKDIESAIKGLLDKEETAFLFNINTESKGDKVTIPAGTTASVEDVKTAQARAVMGLSNSKSEENQK